MTNMNFKQFNFKAYKELGAISLCVFFITFYIGQNLAQAESSRPDIIIDLLLKGDYQAALDKTNAGLPLKREASDIAYLKAFIQSAPFMDHFDPVKAIKDLHEQPNGADDQSLYFTTLDIAVRNHKKISKSSAIGYIEKSIEALNRYNRESTKVEKYLLANANLLFGVDEARALSDFEIGSDSYDPDILNYPDLGAHVAIWYSMDMADKLNKGTTVTAEQKVIFANIFGILMDGVKKDNPASFGLMGALLNLAKIQPPETGLFHLKVGSLLGDEFAKGYLKEKAPETVITEETRRQVVTKIVKDQKPMRRACYQLGQKDLTNPNELKITEDCLLLSGKHHAACRFDYFQKRLDILDYNMKSLYNSCRRFLAMQLLK